MSSPTITHTDVACTVCGCVCDDLGERGLARAGRAPEDDAGQPVGVEHPPQQTAFAQKVPLAGEFIECSRPHADGERLDGASAGFPLGFPKVGHSSIVGMPG